jgi:hypothetical protein
VCKVNKIGGNDAFFDKTFLRRVDTQVSCPGAITITTSEIVLLSLEIVFHGRFIM